MVKTRTLMRARPSAAPPQQAAGIEDRILSSARDLFLAEGVEAVTVRSIAARAGCATGLLYHYFDGKESVLARLLADTFLRLRRELERHASAHHKPERRLTAVLAAYVRFGLDHPHDYALLFQTGSSQAHPHLRRVFHSEGVACYNVIRNCCRDCLPGQPGKRRDGEAELAAQMAWAGVHGLVHLLNTARDFPFCSRRALAARHIAALASAVTARRPHAGHPRAKK